MIAHAVYIPKARTLTQGERAAGVHVDWERAEASSEGGTWDEAKAAAAVPDDGLILYWMGSRGR